MKVFYDTKLSLCLLSLIELGDRQPICDSFKCGANINTNKDQIQIQSMKHVCIKLQLKEKGNWFGNLPP